MINISQSAGSLKSNIKISSCRYFSILEIIFEMYNLVDKNSMKFQSQSGISLLHQAKLNLAGFFLRTQPHLRSWMFTFKMHC